MKPKILCYGDSAASSTGFGQVFRNILTRLTSDFDITQMAINHTDSKDKFGREKGHSMPFEILNARYLSSEDVKAGKRPDIFGKYKLAQYILLNDFDIFFTIQDPLVVKDIIAYFHREDVKTQRKKFGFKVPKTVFYFPVDSDFFRPEWMNIINKFDVGVPYTQYAKNICDKCDPDNKLHQPIYHGFETNIFKKLTSSERKQIREKYGIGNEYTIVNVNRNQPRKDPPRTLQIFKEFKNKVPKSKLVMHCDPEEQFYDLRYSLRYFDLKEGKDVIFTGGKIGETVLTPKEMNEIYNLGDAGLSTNCGEGFGLCEYYNTFVNTCQGYKRIQNVVKGDRIILNNSSFSVLNIAESSKDIGYEVELENGIRLKGSYEHQIPTYFQGYKKQGELQKGDMLLIDKLAFKDEKESITIDLKKYSNRSSDEKVWNKMAFSPKHILSFSKIMKSTNESKKIVESAVKVFFGEKDTKSRRVKKIVKYLQEKQYERPLVTHDRFITVDRNFCRLLGYHVAEGSCSSLSGFEFGFHQKEKDYIEDTINLIKKYFHLKSNVRFRAQNRAEIRCNSSIHANFLVDISGNLSHGKFIPQFIFSNKNYALEFIRGYWRGDGNMTNSSFEMTSVSKRLIYQMQYLLSGFNIYSVIVNRKPVKGGRMVYTIKINGYDRDIFYNLIQETKSGVIDFNPRYSCKKNIIRNNQYFAVKVKNVTTFTPKHNFYDLQIDGIKHFVANNIIVHNSTVDCFSTQLPIILPDNTTARELIGDKEERGYLLKSGFDPSHWTIMPFCPKEPPRPLADVNHAVELLYKVYKKRPNEKIEAALEFAQKNNWDVIASKWRELFLNILEK